MYQVHILVLWELWSIFNLFSVFIIFALSKAFQFIYFLPSTEKFTYPSNLVIFIFGKECLSFYFSILSFIILIHPFFVFA
jgi:hypothetical protein